MRKIYCFLFYCLLCCSPETLAEELFEFNLNCNIRGADHIVYGQIVNKKGDLKILKNFVDDHLANTIRIAQLSAPSNFAIDYFYDDLVGRKVLIFFKSDSLSTSFQPAYFGWETSILWEELEGFKGVLQPTNPGGYELMYFYKYFSFIEAAIENWIFFSDKLEQFSLIPDRVVKRDYLFSIFNWHPFKVEIAQEILKLEKVIDEHHKTNYIENLIWLLWSYKLPTKTDACPCLFLDMYENVYEEILTLYKESVSNAYDKKFLYLVSSVQSNIKYGQHRTPEDLNERFMIEIIKFVEKYPFAGWETEKGALRQTIDAYGKFSRPWFVQELNRVLE